VGGLPRWNDQDLVSQAGFQKIGSEGNVTVMNGIEGTAENGQDHRSSSR
jgi:hypothetical protein